MSVKAEPKLEEPADRVIHVSASERSARGKAARAATPRSSQAQLDLEERDPVALLDEQSASRVPELVPIRYGRMLVSPFTFYRGAARVMAHDLVSTPYAGLTVQLCGDAHLSNFGGFASPERVLVFDLNDFDETLAGPFEWDVKRLAASFEIGGRDRGFDDAERRESVLAVVRAYRKAMRVFARMRNLDVWYSRLDAEAIAARVQAQNSKHSTKACSRAVAKAQTKDSMRAFAKLTQMVDGEPRIISDPPVVVPVEELVEGFSEGMEESIHELYRAYRNSLESSRRDLLESYRLVHLARKVVGVGSVGTRAWIALLIGRDDGDPLFLQIKEAQESVLEPHLGKSRFRNSGKRVVEGQRLMQAASDIFLGWIHSPFGLDGTPRDYYVRQLWDWKTSVDMDRVLPQGLILYARICGWTLARAHARSGDRIAIASYLGKGDVFDRALADFAASYADVNERDYKRLAEAAADGRIVAELGI
jgi:uncharacterized protein (DUF2252 family)